MAFGDFGMICTNAPYELYDLIIIAAFTDW
jgi:hypothetical protein